MPLGSLNGALHCPDHVGHLVPQEQNLFERRSVLHGHRAGRDQQAVPRRAIGGSDREHAPARVRADGSGRPDDEMFAKGRGVDQRFDGGERAGGHIQRRHEPVVPIGQGEFRD